MTSPRPGEERRGEGYLVVCGRTGALGSVQRAPGPGPGPVPVC